MKTYSSLQFSTEAPSVVALGCFDGIHIGHKKVIESAVQTAKASKCQCIVWTFDQPPKNFFVPRSVPLLTTQADKKELIQSLGADTLVCIPFNEEIRQISAEAFFYEILIKRLKAQHIVCGFNYSFGSASEGNIALLEKLCEAENISLTVIPPVMLDASTPVSASVIRQAIEAGETEKVTMALGRPYSVCAPVISGQHLARNLGFPTINQEFSRGLTIPKHGVYLSRLTEAEKNTLLYGITNVGIRPTVGGQTVFAETHIFDFHGDLYGKQIRVELLSFMRSEIKFDSVDALSRQVHKDIEKAKQILAELFNIC